VAVICACVTGVLLGLAILIPTLATKNKGKNGEISSNMVNIAPLLLSQV
jgi:hypothetical protein